MFKWLRNLSLSEQNFGRLVVGLISLGFLALLIAAGTAAWLQLRNQDHLGWVEHTYEVQSAIDEFGALNEQTETARRGFLVSGRPEFRDRFEQSAERTQAALDLIGVETRDNAERQRDVARARAILAQKNELQRRSIALVENGGQEVAIAEFNSDASAPLMQQGRDLVNKMKRSEAELLVWRGARLRESIRTFYWVLAATGLLLLVVAVLSMQVILRYIRDLGTSRAALQELNEDLEGAVRDRTSDLQRANDEIQRFAYIVSHDLRSPLVNVMGFTSELDAARKPMGDLLDRVAAERPDLVSQDAELAVREDLPEAIGFIRTSTQKMDRLINAILQLSRQGRRTVMPERIDVPALLQGIVDSLQHRLKEVGAEIELKQPLPQVVSDRLALEQIFSNLVENAVKYLKPGRPGRISVSGRRESERVLYEIADNGRGIDPKDHERVFDLFRRSGQQDQPGEGIGLAHVRAMAYRLGGTIELQSQLDQGATFRLSLPREFIQAQGITR